MKGFILSPCRCGLVHKIRLRFQAKAEIVKKGKGRDKPRRRKHEQR